MPQAFQISINGLADVHEDDRPQLKTMTIKARNYFADRNLLLDWASIKPPQEKSDGYRLYISVLSPEVLTSEVRLGIAGSLGEMGFEAPAMHGAIDTRITFRSKKAIRMAGTPSVTDLHLRSGIEGVGSIHW